MPAILLKTSFAILSRSILRSFARLSCILVLRTLILYGSLKLQVLISCRTKKSVNSKLPLFLLSSFCQTLLRSSFESLIPKWSRPWTKSIFLIFPFPFVSKKRKACAGFEYFSWILIMIYSNSLAIWITCSG